MKRIPIIYIYLLSFLYSLNIFSQMPGSPHGGGPMMPDGMKSGARQARTSTPGVSGIGEITGTVVDAESLEPLQYAIVSVIDPYDTTIVTGAITDKNGYFNIKDIPVGQYIVRIKFISYVSARNDSLKITPKNPQKDYGIIKLNPDNLQTGEVVVTEKRNFIQNMIDKKVVNVDETILTISKSAKEVLEQVPSVSTDIDGNINLRGNSSVTILVDGRQSALTNSNGSTALDMIPASSIEKIEIITNPSAKYDAEGMSGIINIILKKDRELGINGISNISASTSNNYNASLNTNAKYGDLNFYANYGFRYDDFNMHGSTTRTSYSDSIDITTRQTMSGDHIFRFHSLNGGLDYYLNERNTIGMSVKYFAPITSMSQENSYIMSGSGAGSSRLSSSDGRGNSLEYSIYHDLNFSNSHTLSSTVSYSDNQNNNDDYYSGSSLDQLWRGTRYQRQFKVNDTRLLIIQSDYTLPIGRKSSFEAGLKNSRRQLDNDLIFERKEEESGIWESDGNISNHFIYNENIFALYATFQSVTGDFGYKIGLRMEQTQDESEQKMTGEKNDNKYLDFFPNAYFSFNPSDNEQYKISYSYRINRPNPEFLNPFSDLSDPLNIRKGNPYLKPEYTHSVEFGYSHNYSILYLNASIYGRHTTDLINRIMKPDTSMSYIITIENFNKRSDLGFELSNNFYFSDWWDAMVSLNAFRSYYSGSIDNSTISSNKFNWMIHFMTNINLSGLLRIQLSGNYLGRMTTPQGTNRPMYGVDIALKKDFFDGKASLALNAGDIFNSRQFRIDFNGNGYTQEVTRKRDTRSVSLTFSYKFGSAFSDENKRQRRKASDINPGEKFDMF